VERRVAEASINRLFGLLLLGHALHVAEEALGRFWLVDFFGLPVFLAGNILLWIAAVALFLQVKRGPRWAFTVSLVYVAFMVLQGIGHNLAWAVSGRYFGGFAGGISGLLMFAVGVPLWVRLRQSIPPRPGSFA
jgi:hypothetical protein